MVECLSTLRLDSQLGAIYPGAEYDKLFDSKYCHIGDKEPCDRSGCDGKVIPRDRLLSAPNLPLTVYFGLIACGDLVMKLAEECDSIVL